ncbi:MAG: tRNA uracil 4-sulfurtransferase ThiI [Methanolinea sp.]|nr:tRNA uracil 4-sulfurtransferase ThiI [Methanolinea sp.]
MSALREGPAVMVRYGEIFLKSSPVHREFTGVLLRNCRQALLSEGLATDARVMRGRIFFYGNSPGKVADVLSRVFGIVDVAVCTVTAPDPDAVTRAAVALAARSLGSGMRFAVRARREGVPGITSQDLAARVGSAVLSAIPGAVVDLDNPDYEVHVELRASGGVVYDRRIPAPGGLPLGTQGRVLVLLSAGIDSPVAAWLMMKRGCEVTALHVSPGGPAGEETVAGVLGLASVLSEWCRGFPIRVLVVDAGPFYQRLVARGNPRFRCILCKRFMVRLGSLLAMREGIPAICTGENLGQVASQTLQNLAVISRAATVPLFRPLVAYDKQEIVALGRKIGSFERAKSTLSCPYVPPTPATVSDEGTIAALEEGFWGDALGEALLSGAEEYVALNGSVSRAGSREG